jgi:hypothetical protein
VQRVRVGDTVRVPWGLDVATGDVLELQGPPHQQHVVVSIPILGSSGEVLDQTTVTFSLDAVDVVHATVIDDRDVSPPGMDGWIQRYRVAVADEEITVDVWCSGTAEAMAPHNDDIKSVVHDRGRSWAVRAAKHAQPRRGASATVQCDSNGPTIRYEYGGPRSEGGLIC